MITRRTSLALLAASAAFASPLLAQDSTDPNGASAQGDLSVTIYNNGQALVQDIRQ